MPEKSEVDVLFPDGIKFALCGKEYVVLEFTLNKRTQFLKIVSAAFVKFAEANPETDTAKIKVAEVLAPIIDAAGDKLGELYALVLDEPLEYLGTRLTLKKELELLESILEVNDISFLVEKAKQIINKFQKATQ